LLSSKDALKSIIKDKVQKGIFSPSSYTEKPASIHFYFKISMNYKIQKRFKIIVL